MSLSNPKLTEAVPLWVIAVSHEESAAHLRAGLEKGIHSYGPWHSIVFLYFRSIELALKSYLLAKGTFSLDQLRSKKLGHNIHVLFSEAQKSGFNTLLQNDGNSLNEAESKVLKDFGPEYATKGYEYPEHVFPKKKVTLPALSSVCRKIVFAAESALKRQRYSHSKMNESMERLNVFLNPR